MKVVYTNHFPPTSSHKQLRIILRLAQMVVVAFAIVGALHLIDVSPFASSTASTVSVVEPIAPAPSDYFPGLFVNQATHIEDPIEQF